MNSIEGKTAALLVIDVQNDFCADDGFFARAGQPVAPCRAIVPTIARLTDACRSRGARIVFTRTVLSAGESEPQRHRIRPERDRSAPRVGLCRPGSPGAEIVSELQPQPGDEVLEKRRYSAFYGTDLEQRLRGMGIDTLIVTGMTTNACVDSTVRDAYFRGFDVVVVSDAVAAYEPHLHTSSLENFRLLFGAVEPSSEVLRALGVASAGHRRRRNVYAPQLADSSGPFSHAVEVDAARLVLVSGQVARNKDGSVEGVGDATRQTEKLLENMRDVLAQSDCSLDDVVSVTIYVTHIEDVPSIHRVRERYFGDNRPASTLVEVGRLVHPDFRVEISAIAVASR